MDRWTFPRRSFLAGATALGATGLLLPSTAVFAQAAEPKRGGHLKLGIDGGASTDTLDPALSSGSATFVIVNTWGDTLVESHPESGAPLPSLATEWGSSPDAKVWTFKLRQGVKFHDGAPFTAADAVATLKRHSDENSKSGALGLLSGISAIEEKGGDLVITLGEGNADLPLLLTDYHLQMQPGGGVDKPDAAIGTGPYRLKEFQPGVRAVLEKNQDDWRSDRGHVDTVEILVMNDATARVAALSSGQVDFISTVNPKTVSLLERAPNVEIVNTAGKGFYAFLMFCDTAPFDNADLRMAMKLAVDREAILKQILNGYGRIGNDFPVNQAYALFPEGIEQRAYDPEQAASLYKKSGHSGPIVLRTSDAAFPGAVDAAVLYKEQASKAGIDIQVQREPADGYWSNVWNVQPFCASYWGGRPTQDLRYSTSFISSAEWNDTRFKRPEFDKLVTEARAELDEAKRKEMYHACAMMVRDDGGAIIPVFNDYVNAKTKRVQGWVDDIGNDFSNGKIASRVWLEG